MEATIALSREAISFEEFVESEYDRVLRAMYLACGSRDLAEEITQHAMVRAFERWDRIAALESPVGYVMKIAFSRQRSWFRSAARLVLHPNLGRDAPAERALDDAASQVMEILESLPLSQRQAVVLVEWFGLNSEEAGRILGIDAASVRGRIHRARTSLRQSSGGDDA